MPEHAPRLLMLCGSLRAESLNRKAVEIAARAAEAAGAVIDRTAPKDLALPLYDQDDEAASGFPDAVLKLRERMQAADGFLVACPEFNGTMTAAMKNAIDWASRPREGEAQLACFRGKTAGLVAASPGKLGGIRGLPETRRVLSGIGVHVIAGDFALGNAHEMFDDQGNCKDDGVRAGIENVGTTLAKLTAAIKNS